MPSGPKTNKYTNRHSEEARLRNEERQLESRAAHKASVEDAKWAETDAKVLKKLEKQREQEQKQAEKAARDAEKKEQLAEEEREMNAKVPAKVSKRQIQKDLSKMLADYDRQRDAIRGVQHGAVVEPAKNEDSEVLPSGNVNRERGVASLASGNRDPNTISVSGKAGDVLAALEGKTTGKAEIPDDRHIGKRARVLYKVFYAESYDAVKEERPGLRRSQYNDIIWEMWQLSPSNPLVLRNEKIAQQRLDEERRWMEGDSEGDEEEEAKA
ncbi:hypothetical protein ABL78_0728 [Leptomonas seymouri]|uniref:Coiled-coil domain-containing protein n=1 Tax=Leptomonas seymouri TaxID=5684 RepID=A0A0N1I1R4_LEPSE|nr:hypothetical protein ABL78_0728 [Leptomonas seymouri]|eukprot:KPI90210.1 hypothetical protein ABL78_0728 [Leptomonas seymouri]